MSLPRNQQEELFSADNELADFLPADDPMMVFSREIYPAFKDEDFAQCYSTKGRWATSPAFLACVTILQFRENLSDPETAEACVRRLDWKIALHLPVGEKTSFHPSTLCYYRRRLRDHEAMSLIFDKTVKLAQEKGFIKKRTSQRIDSTKIIAHVNRIATTDLLFRAVKCLTEEIEKRKGSTSSGCSPVNPCLKAVQMHQAYLKYVSVLIKYTLAADGMQGGGLVNTNWEPQPMINST